MDNQLKNPDSSSEPLTPHAPDTVVEPGSGHGDNADHGKFTPPGAPQKSNKMLIIIVAAVVALLVAGGIAYAMMSGKKKTTTTQTNTPVVKETGDIVFGLNTDLSLPSTVFFGTSMKQGMDLAIEEINATGGIDGRKLKSIALDDKGDPATAKKNAEQLINQDKVNAIIGATHATSVLSWIDLAQDSETTVFIPAAPSTILTQKFAQRPRNYIFRISANDLAFCELATAWTVKQTNNGKIAILADNRTYGQQGLKDYTEVLARWGKTPVATASFTPGITEADMKKHILDMKAAGAEGILLQTAPDATITFLKALATVPGYNPAISGSGANLTAALPQGAGALASKVSFPTGVGASLNDKTKALNDKLTAKNGKATPIFAIAAQAYDATYMLKAAIEKAGTTEKKAMRDALENTQGFQGVIKKFDKPFSKTNHEAMGARDIYMVHWQGAQVVPYTKEQVGNLEVR
jgi:branched-chain amino acid transport system substrate-binding protein